MKKTIFSIIFIALLLAGCSHSPVPNAKNFEENEQNLFQAAHHWELLAEQQAESLMNTVYGKKSFYLDSEDHNSPFGQAFHSLLGSNLVSRGADLLTENKPGAFVISYKVQIISHNIQGPVTHDFSDLADLLFFIREAPEQKFEVLITTIGTQHDRILMSDSQLYYIYPQNAYNYQQVANDYRVFKVTQN